MNAAKAKKWYRLRRNRSSVLPVVPMEADRRRRHGLRRVHGSFDINRRQFLRAFHTIFVVVNLDEMNLYHTGISGLRVLRTRGVP